MKKTKKKIEGFIACIKNMHLRFCLKILNWAIWMRSVTERLAVSHEVVSELLFNLHPRVITKSAIDGLMVGLMAGHARLRRENLMHIGFFL